MRCALPARFPTHKGNLHTHVRQNARIQLKKSDAHPDRSFLPVGSWYNGHYPGRNFPVRIGFQRRLLVIMHQIDRELVDAERCLSAEALGERSDEFMQLKVEGILECAELLVAALPEGRGAHVFGRRTLPEMDLASLSCAIQNVWLAARAEGLGMGWVSLFDPLALAQLLNMPAGARPVAVLCLGPVDAFYARPMLEQEGWAQGRALDELIFTDSWGQS